MRTLSPVPEQPGGRVDPLDRSQAGNARPGAGTRHCRSLTLERATRIGPLVVSVAVGLATAILMLATEPQLAIGWDEGYTLGREARLRDWFRGLRDPAGFAKRWQPMPREEDLVQWDETRTP